MKKYLVIVILIFICWVLFETFNFPGVKDLKGDFKQEAFVRNENNTGPVIRIYSASLNDTLWNEMESYGNFMPHTKYGTTQVYFFLNNEGFPDKLSLEGDHFDEVYKMKCVARYEKDGMGRVSLIRYPFLK